MDVRKDTTRCDGDSSEKLVQFLIITDGELDVTRDNALLLVVTGCVTSELKDLSGEVLKDSGEVHRGTSTDAGSVTSNTEVTMNAANRELEASLGRA